MRKNCPYGTLVTSTFLDLKNHLMKAAKSCSQIWEEFQIQMCFHYKFFYWGCTILVETQPLRGEWWSITHLHDFSCDFLLAEPVDDDMGGHSGHTQHPALWAPGQGLDGKRVLLHNVRARLLLLGASSLKNFGCLQLVEHLQHDCDERTRYAKILIAHRGLF